MATERWNFGEPDGTGMLVTGDIGSLVRNKAYKNNGVLNFDPPTDGSVLLARELIQNSWDSAHERKKDDASAPPFLIRFEFTTVQGSEKGAFVAAAGMEELKERASKLGPDLRIIQNRDVLEQVTDESEPLRILRVVEVGTNGMHGPTSRPLKCKLLLAMCSVGFSFKEGGLGGSYGQGKVGLIRGTGTRTVFAYTAFARTAKDENTRRLLGVTYWNEHTLGAVDYVGWARYEDGEDPYADEQADTLATALGMAIRSPNEAEEIGSTFLLIDPLVEPRDLKAAVERYWWPALVDDETEFTVEIQDYDGQIVRPEPRRDPTLEAFIQAYGLTQHKAVDGPSYHKFLNAVTLSDARNTRVEPGQLALIADNSDDGWSNATDEDVEHCSLVAFIRSPKMVVKYAAYAQGSRPYVRGVFRATPESNQYLGATEPGLHDEWRTDPVDDLPPEPFELSRVVLKRIAERVRKFRNDVREELPTLEKRSLALFDKLMRDLMGTGRGRTETTVVEPEPRDISVQFAKPGEPQIAPGGLVSFTASLKFAPMPQRTDECPLSVRLEVTYRLIEDGRLGTPWDLVLKDPPPGFAIDTSQTGRVLLTGLLDESGVVFRVQSAPHDPDWMGQFDPAAELVKQGPGDLHE